MTDNLLEVENLKMHFPIHGGILRRKVGWVYAVDGVSLSVREGETLGLVGESGCGKTTVGRTIARLYRPTAGKVNFDGKNLARLNQQELREVRRDLQMIFQDPVESHGPRPRELQNRLGDSLSDDLGRLAARLLCARDVVVAPLLILDDVRL